MWPLGAWGASDGATAFGSGARGARRAGLVVFFGVRVARFAGLTVFFGGSAISGSAGFTLSVDVTSLADAQFPAEALAVSGAAGCT